DQLRPYGLADPEAGPPRHRSGRCGGEDPGADAAWRCGDDDWRGDRDAGWPDACAGDQGERRSRPVTDAAVDEGPGESRLDADPGRRAPEDPAGRVDVVVHDDADRGPGGLSRPGVERGRHRRGDTLGEG